MLLTSALSETSKMLPGHRIPETDDDKLNRAGCLEKSGKPICAKLDAGTAGSECVGLRAGNGGSR